jgi:hypothetical protein
MHEDVEIVILQKYKNKKNPFISGISDYRQGATAEDPTVIHEALLHHRI